MKYYGLKVYDLEESLVASGFPMLEEAYTSTAFDNEVENLRFWLLNTPKDEIISDSKCKISDLVNEGCSPMYIEAIKHIKRGITLGNAKSGSGHDCFEKGCLVSVNIQAPQHFWLQFERYGFQDTVSSMSSMHRIAKMNIKEIANKYVDDRVINVLNELIEEYNENPTAENFHKVANNIPEGIELTRRITTNYLQLKTMYAQRKHHKMKDWSVDFVGMCESLPWFNELVLKK